MEGLQEITQQIAHALETEGNVRSLFGEPMKIGERTVIPVASVTVIVAGGSGAVGALARRLLPGGLLKGGGGSAQVILRPVGFISDGKDGAVFTPIPIAHEPHAHAHEHDHR